MGKYVTNDIREARRAGNAGDRNIDGWLHWRVGPVYGALRADRSKAKSADQLRASVANRLAGLASLPATKDRGDSTSAHADFTAAHNAFVAVHGLPLAKHRMF